MLKPSSEQTELLWTPINRKTRFIAQQFVLVSLKTHTQSSMAGALIKFIYFSIIQSEFVCFINARKIAIDSSKFRRWFSAVWIQFDWMSRKFQMNVAAGLEIQWMKP